MLYNDDGGETLLEVLITLMLVGIGVAGVLAALMTGLQGSRSTQATTDSRALLVAAAEQLQAAPYVGCAGPTGYAAALASAFTSKAADGTNVSVITVKLSAIDFWGANAAGSLAFSSDCAYDNIAGAQGRLQRITLQTTSDESLTIVKKAS